MLTLILLTVARMDVRTWNGWVGWWVIKILITHLQMLTDEVNRLHKAAEVMLGVVSRVTSAISPVYPSCPAAIQALS